ncbi:hypothetical protein MBLNU13_g07811t2 [Cladosporium sp. NU13]
MAEGTSGSSSSSSGSLVLEKELTCSICTDVMYQPLTLLDCLHTFCGSCLKEWFAWQATSAARSRRTTNPYTCPSCRAEVRGTRPNATVTTLLDMFLASNPGRGKSEAEKDEMRSHYKPGEDVIPPVEITRDSDESEDERLMDEGRRTESSRRRERSSRRTGQQARSADVRPREQDADGRQVEHQPSLRSLLSESGPDSLEVQEEIMQSILASGVLEGIDIDHLTPEQEEELTERIAEAYRRRRHRHREPPSNQERRIRAGSESRPASSGNVERRQRTRGDSNVAPSSQTTEGQRAPLVHPAKGAIVPQTGQMVQRQQSALPLAQQLIFLLRHTQKIHKENAGGDHRVHTGVLQIQMAPDT